MSGWLAWGGLSLAGAAATAVVLNQPDSRSFPLPINSARERLATATLPAEVLGLGGGQAVLSREGDNLVWKLGGGAESGEVRIELEADGASTDVSWSLDLPARGGPGSGILSSDLFGDVAVAALEEHIDATLWGRAFDPQKALNATARDLQANPQKLEAFGKAVRNDMIAIHEQINETAKGSTFPPRAGAAYVKSGDGRDFTKPMTELNP